MSLPITYKLTCKKCGYPTVKTVGDADIEIIFIQCPRCRDSMKREPTNKAFSFGSFFDKLFKS